MDISYLIKVVTIILTTSVATERLVEIVKGWSQWLSAPNLDANEERKRQNRLHILAVIGGMITAWLASPVIAAVFGFVEGDEFETTLAVILIGLCASGGSSFWNSILTYLLKAKDIKVAGAETLKSEARLDQAANQKISTLLKQSGGPSRFAAMMTAAAEIASSVGAAVIQIAKSLTDDPDVRPNRKLSELGISPASLETPVNDRFFGGVHKFDYRSLGANSTVGDVADVVKGLGGQA